MRALGPGGPRCGIDTVEIARIERLLRETPAEDLGRIFSAGELADAALGPGRAASLAARFAAKEACLKLFPREAASEAIGPADFAVERDAYRAPRVALSPAARDVLGRNRVEAIALSLTHDRASASAIALAEPARARPSLAGRLLYHLVPLRRAVVLENLRRVFGEAVPPEELKRLAQAHYGHLARLGVEFLWFPWLSAERRSAMVRVENLDALLGAHARGKGVLILTGHFGNWEIATAAALQRYPEGRGRFHFVRRAFKPRWVDRVVSRRFRRAGFGIVAKHGGLGAILDRLAARDLVVFPFDQHAARRDGVVVDFFGSPASTFRSLAILALGTGAPVVPGASWREPDGTHVLRFEEPLPLIECDDVGEAIRRNSRAYNAALERLILRHPEQWWWVHRRWKAAGAPPGRAASGAPARLRDDVGQPVRECP
jgi:KDO2-lipid IV(A) lauroyltransferase